MAEQVNSISEMLVCLSNEMRENKYVSWEYERDINNHLADELYYVGSKLRYYYTKIHKINEFFETPSKLRDEDKEDKDKEDKDDDEDKEE